MLGFAEPDAAAGFAQVDAHAAREDGAQQVVGQRGDEDDEGLRRGLFEGFEEGVGGFFAHAVCFDDDDEFGFAFLSAQGEEGLDGAHFFDEDAPAFRAGAQDSAHGVQEGFEALGMCAVERGGEVERELMGAGLGGAGEEQCVRQAVGVDGVVQQVPGLFAGEGHGLSGGCGDGSRGLGAVWWEEGRNGIGVAGGRGGGSLRRGG